MYHGAGLLNSHSTDYSFLSLNCPDFVCLEYHGTLPLGGCVTPGGCDTWRNTGVKLCYDDYKYISEYMHA